VNARQKLLCVVGVGAAAVLVYSLTSSGSTGIGGIVDKVTSTIRGIRDNNPTNLEDSGIQWNGLVGTDGVYLKFDTMANGLRAAALNLRNYWRLHGINTIEGIAQRWSATDQAAYVANLSTWLQVDAQDSLDMEDTGVLAQLLKGMVRQEDGLPAELLVDSQIDAAVLAI
jgi:hypothetical protein